MNDAEDVRRFVQQGLTAYPAALDAIELFELQIRQAVHRAVDEKRDWMNFRRALGADGQLVPGKDGLTGTTSRWLWTYYTGEKRGDDATYLTLGLAWNPPKLGNGTTVAYAGFTIGSRVMSFEDRPDRDPRVKLGSLDRNERRPYIVVGSDFDPDVDFRLLLDAADAALPSRT